jgi:hypothetical protein
MIAARDFQFAWSITRVIVDPRRQEVLPAPRAELTIEEGEAKHCR